MQTVAFVLLIGMLDTQITAIQWVPCNSPNDQIGKWHFRCISSHPKSLPHQQVNFMLLLASLLCFVDVVMTVHG